MDRRFLEAVLYLHYVSINSGSNDDWRAAINLDMVLKRMISIYIPSEYVKEYEQILFGKLVYQDVHIARLCNMMQTSDIPKKYMYGCLLKVLFRNKPDMLIVPGLLSDLMILMTSSNDQYGASIFFSRQLCKSIASEPPVVTMNRMIAVTDAITLSYVQRTPKFTILKPIFNTISLNDLIFTNMRELLINANQSNQPCTTTEVYSGDLP
jgi:hypothetical protein